MEFINSLVVGATLALIVIVGVLVFDRGYQIGYANCEDEYEEYDDSSSEDSGSEPVEKEER